MFNQIKHFNMVTRVLRMILILRKLSSIIMNIIKIVIKNT